MKYDKMFQNTYKHMGPSVMIAMVSTILGFTALFISPVPMIADFGKTLTIGLVVSFFAALIILTTSLHIRDKYFCDHTKAGTCILPKESNGLERFLSSLTEKVLSRKFLVLSLCLIVTAWGIFSDAKVGVQTDIEKFMPQDTQELQEIRELRELVGSADQLTVMVQSDNLLTAENVAWLDDFTQQVTKEFPGIINEAKSMTSLYRNITMAETLSEAALADFLDGLPEAQRKLFIDAPQKTTVVTLHINRLKTDLLREFIADLNQYLDDHEVSGLDTQVTGKAVIDAEMLTALTAGRLEMTLLGIGLVFLGLLFIYRDIVKALIPVFPISLIVGWSGAAMYLLGIDYTPLTATMGALIIGIGTEFTILLMERYYEERAYGVSKQAAMITTVSKIGKPILASALTTIGGFSALIFSDFTILREFGIVTLLNITFCLVSAFIVLPPLIIMLDRKKVSSAQLVTQT